MKKPKTAKDLERYRKATEQMASEGKTEEKHLQWLANLPVTEDRRGKSTVRFEPQPYPTPEKGKA